MRVARDINPGVVTVAPAGAAVNFSAGTTSNNLASVVFSNSNGVSFGLNGSTITASMNAAGGGLTNIKVSAGTLSALRSDLTFNNSNGVSFGLETNGVITATVQTNYLTTAMQSNAATISNIKVSAGTVSALRSDITFNDGNGISFGLSGNGVITATVKTDYQSSNANYLTSQSNQAASGSNGSFTFQTLSFSNANGISFGSSAGPAITASYTVPTVTNSSWTVSDAATSGSVAQLAFTNLNGITLSLSTGAGGSHTIVGSYTVPTQSNQTLGLFVTDNTTLTTSTTRDARSITFAGEGNVSVGYSNGSVIISGGTAAPSPVNFSAGTTSNNLGAVVFSNSNNVSFGLNGSTITATASVATSLTNINVSAGTTSNNLSNLVFSNSNNISFGLNGSTVTASIPYYTVSTFMNQQPANVSSGINFGQNQVVLAPMRLAAPVSASTGMVPLAITGTITSNATHTVGATLGVALYKVTGTNLSRFDTTFTTSFGFTFWNSGTASVSYSYNVTSGSSAGSNLMTASVYGALRLLTFNIGSVLDTGLYAWGYVESTSSAGGSSIMRSLNVLGNVPFLNAGGFIGSALAGSLGWADAGSYSATSGAMPASFLLSEIVPLSNIVPLIKFGAY